MTTSELEALVGHLFVVGGRAISAASPGSVAMPPPRRAARGRHNDTLFGLISLGVGEHQPAAFYESLVEEMTSTYFKASGSVTSALRTAIQAVNESVRRMNSSRGEPLAVGLSCAIMREQEVYLAVVGAARCFLAREGFIERLPDDEDMDERAVGLGTGFEPDVQFFRREIRSGDFLLLADSSFDRLTDATFQHAIADGEVNSALNNLAGVSGPVSSAEVIKFVSPLIEGEEDTVPVPERRPVSPLPTFSPSGETEAPVPARSQPAAGEPTTAAEKRIVEHAPAGDANAFQRFRHRLAIWLSNVFSRSRTLVEKMLPEEEPESESEALFSTPMQIGVAVAVAVLVALLTTVVYQWQGQSSQYAQFVLSANDEIQKAREGGSNQAVARPHWEAAVYLLDQAAEIRTPGKEILELREQALTALDSYDHVTRVELTQLREYDPGSVLKGPVVQGLNLYTIDTTQDILYREDLSEDGASLVNRESQVVTRQGDVVSNQVVGGLIDLNWIEDGGVQQKNVLGVLSRNGLLITYSPSWDVTANLLPGFEAWVDPRAFVIYERDLYVLDAGANEIWVYNAGAEAYSAAPQRYFTDVLPELGDAVDMEIDSNGNIYVLHTGGRITKYFFGQTETFAFSGLPQPLARPMAMFLNLSLYDRTLYVADPGGGRLYATASNGTFLLNYKDADDTVFDALSGVFSQDRPAFVYLTAGNGLYTFPRP
ncbi:MAG: hypothetical protein JXJ17_14030 [Anaerolineae bacterium]|nr:hypothetical protein [Anaerolineae bacterium]